MLMDISCRNVVPHPQFLEALFTYKSKVFRVFRDVLGLHEINHIAITQVSKDQEILTFSSTPAMEFNLFNSNLWRFDKTYHPDWFSKTSQAKWQSLYDSERYDELYYLKQVKHHYPIGCSLAVKSGDFFLVYSLASARSCSATREVFSNNYPDFYKIGQYCTNRLHSLFTHYHTQAQQAQVEHEASN